MPVSNSGSNTVSVVDLESHGALTRIAVGRDPRHTTIVGDGAYVSLRAPATSPRSTSPG
ncbi:hypothetical protein [Kitasatospora sp. NPDC007106]